MKKPQNIDRVILHSGQSLMGGDPRQLAARNKYQPNQMHQEIQSFGLWDLAVPTFSNYYPDVTEDDLILKEGEFISPIFRALSEVIVHKRWNPIDFSMNGVLKASMNKLLGQTVYANHEPAVGNEIGAVARVFWQDSYTIDGLTVPAGINAEFKIDAKANPKIARNILMEPPAIHSNSVTVEFAWEKSHSTMDNDEFWMRVGKLGSDGQLVRRIVTDIPNYHETSLVAHGADPFAQRTNSDGTIVNPGYATSVYGLSAKTPKEQKLFYFSYKEDVVSLSSDNTIPNELNNKDNTQNSSRMKKSFVLLLATLAGISLSEKDQNLSDEAFEGEGGFDYDQFSKDLETALKDKSAEVTRLTGQLTEIQTKLTASETDLASTKASLSTINASKVALDAFMQSKRDEVTRLYSLLNPQPLEAIINSFQTADLSTLNAFEKQYVAELDEKMPATCQSCGSHEISRASASSEGDPKKKDKNRSVTEKVQDLARRKFSGATFTVHPKGDK